MMKVDLIKDTLYDFIKGENYKYDNLLNFNDYDEENNKNIENNISNANINFIKNNRESKTSGELYDNRRFRTKRELDNSSFN